MDVVSSSITICAEASERTMNTKLSAQPKTDTGPKIGVSTLSMRHRCPS